MNYFSKVHIFWVGHYFFEISIADLSLCSNGQIYGGDFANFWGLLRIYELYSISIDELVLWWQSKNKTIVLLLFHLKCIKLWKFKNGQNLKKNFDSVMTWAKSSIQQTNLFNTVENYHGKHIFFPESSLMCLIRVCLKGRKKT